MHLISFILLPWMSSPVRLDTCWLDKTTNILTRNVLESAMGIKINAQNDPNSKFVEANTQ